jgi:hypothetical protein
LTTIFSFHSFAGFITKIGGVLDVFLSFGLVKDKLRLRIVEMKFGEIYECLKKNIAKKVDFDLKNQRHILK